MNDAIPGTPLRLLLWKRALNKIEFSWRDVPHEERIDFLRDLVASVNREFIDALKNPLADYQFPEPNFNNLPKPSISSAEWDEIMEYSDVD